MDIREEGQMRNLKTDYKKEIIRYLAGMIIFAFAAVFSFKGKMTGVAYADAAIAAVCAGMTVSNIIRYRKDKHL